jgi:hypothetical protein
MSRPVECPREADVLDAVAAARWPDRLPPALASHVAQCAICADLAEVAHALSAEHDAAWAEAEVAPSGQVWWRAEMRAREEAMRAAARPLTVVDGLAGAAAVGVLAAIVRVAWPWVSALASWPIALPMVGPLGAMALGALGLFLVVTPVVFYLALSDE